MSNLCKENSLMRDNKSYTALTKQQQAETDEQVIGLWLHGRSQHTQKAYRRDIDLFLKFRLVPLHQIKLLDLQQFADSLFIKHLSVSSIHRITASIKSLLSFACKIGYIQFDAGKCLKVPNSKDVLSQRILTEEEVQKIIASVKNDRNRLIIQTLYYTGIRISELVSLKWSDLQPRTEGGQMTILGKGNKTNNLIIPSHLWDELMLLRTTLDAHQPVFRSKKGGHLNCGHVQRLLKNISLKAIGKPASPHFFRHSHASHALENGAPIHLVQQQLNHSSIATTGRYLHARPSESSSKYLK